MKYSNKRLLMKSTQLTMKQFARTTLAVAVSMCFISIAQAQAEATQRVEITGSSIKRIRTC
jgi:hypothetical protein